MSNDVQFQIECLTSELVQMLMKGYNWDMRRALDELYDSQLYAKLNDPDCGLYYQSAVYLFQLLNNEMAFGKIG